MKELPKRALGGDGGPVIVKKAVVSRLAKRIANLDSGVGDTGGFGAIGPDVGGPGGVAGTGGVVF